MTSAVQPLMGRISYVRPRDVWAHEAHDFTPWLLSNVDVLSDLLGMDLVLEEAEHPVGDFSLDLKGLDEATGQTVIVENQLEISDHLHLGQILTYAAGTDPTTIVWVATGFRPEHRAAIDWLNERTDEKTRFFGVEIQVIRIGDSAPAPAFQLVAQPNDWGKQVRAAAASATGEVSERQRLYQDFWERVRERVTAEYPTWTQSRQATKQSWFPMGTGVSGVTWSHAFTRQGLGVQLVFEDADPDKNTSRFEALAEKKAAFEGAFGGPVTWEDLDGRKSCRVSTYTEHVYDVAEQASWSDWIEWVVTTSEKMRQALQAVGGVPDPTPLAPSKWPRLQGNATHDEPR